MKQSIFLILILILSIVTPMATVATSPAVTVAVLDSGSNLADAAGRCFITDTSDITDSAGHGTQIHTLLASLAPSAEIVILKCFDDSMSFDEDAVIRAIYAAVDDYKADVINMSWTVNVESEALYEAVCYAYQSGAILVAPVGNLSLTTRLGSKTWPAAWDEVIGVGGVNLDENDKPVSSLAYLRGETIFVCANAEFDGEKGTSYAAPRISAVIANHIAVGANSVRPQITHENILQMLKNSAIDLGEPGFDTTFGWGYIGIARPPSPFKAFPATVPTT